MKSVKLTFSALALGFAALAPQASAQAAVFDWRPSEGPPGGKAAWAVKTEGGANELPRTGGVRSSIVQHERRGLWQIGRRRPPEHQAPLIIDPGRTESAPFSLQFLQSIGRGRALGRGEEEITALAKRDIRRLAIDREVLRN